MKLALPMLLCLLLFSCSMPSQALPSNTPLPETLAPAPTVSLLPAETASVASSLTPRPSETVDIVVPEYAAGAPVSFQLEEYDESLCLKADGWTNGGMFNCTWRGKNIGFSKGVMSLQINIDTPHTNPYYSGAEYRTLDFYSYGLFEVSMKPIKNPGIISSFFTYTGPSDENPWDEIDIEFLGKDTTLVQFNTFKNGAGNNEKIWHLGFDAAEEFHEYAFLWLPDGITWFVDDSAVYQTQTRVPVTPQRIMMNVWPSTNKSWVGAFDGTLPLYAEYDWFRYTPLADSAK